MKKVLSAKRIEELLTNAIKVDSKYINTTTINNKSLLYCDIEDDDYAVTINVYEEHFSELFYKKYYNDYHDSNFRKNSINRKELHKHLFEKWYGILKYIEKQFDDFSVDVYIHHMKNGQEHKYYPLSEIELILGIDPDGEEEDFDGCDDTFNLILNERKMVIDKWKKMGLI